MLLAGRVADRVRRTYPDMRFGVLAYVNYSMPPAKQKVHPSVIPVIAPIDFNRHHPMTWTNHPNDHWLLDMVQGWAKVAPRMGYYAYGMNLAELSAPCPFNRVDEPFTEAEIEAILDGACRDPVPEEEAPAPAELLDGM